MSEVPNPFAGLAPNLVPNPPPPVPEAPGAGDAMASASPFNEALDADQIIRNLMLDRPLKLFIPNKEKYPDWEFRIINSTPAEIADAQNKGFREVSDPELVSLFRDLVAGHDKEGKAFRPVLMSRPKKVGEHIRRHQRQQLQNIYTGMDPQNKDFGGGYAKKVDRSAGSDAEFRGNGWRIRV